VISGRARRRIELSDGGRILGADGPVAGGVPEEPVPRRFSRPLEVMQAGRDLVRHGA
jgi:hypothetical protein